MKFRLAKKCDSKELAILHMECSRDQAGGFMHNLGINFLIRYYKIILNNKYSLVLVAEDTDGRILGFHSGTLSTEEHLSQLKKNKLILALSIIPKFCLNPSIIREVLKRYFSISKISSLNDFGVKEGVRGEYWCWSTNNSNPMGAISLYEKWFNLVKELGVDKVFIEVDTINKRILGFHKSKGAEIIRQIDLFDGRKRLIMMYKLNN
jgi:hypothetical protein